MGDDDDAEQPRQHGGGGHHFRVGSRVEVLSNEDQGGVYFTATVIQSKVSLRRSKNPEQVYVRYHTLLASEGRADRLTEHVDVSSVRPAPPSLVVTNPFQANDVIDAFYNDGWWKGVVSRVVGNGDGERIKVIFEKWVDEFEFRRSAIRPHWDWIDGVFAGLQNLGGVELGVGNHVEVSIEGDNAWFPAVVVRGLENGGFLVELSLVRGEVDSANVRPYPPILKERRFEKSERVDAFFDFRWWSGVITETKIKNRKNGYNVFFEEMNLNKVFDVFELRAHMDWKDGKWFLAYSLTSNSEIASSSIKRRSDSKSSTLKKHKIEDNSSVLIDEGSNEVLPDCGWPFVKRSVHWKAMESMEVFRKMPQKPHFEPLSLSKEIEREGMAIGYMVTFSNVVDICSSLQMDDPEIKCVVEDLNATLLKLEAHGFDLGMVRDFVMKVVEAEDIQNQIGKHKYKKNKFDRNIEVINGHIRMLQEQLELAQICNANEDKQIARLQTEFEQILQQISSLNCDCKAPS